MPPELAPFGREYDPTHIRRSLDDAVREALATVDATQVRGIAVTGQRIACAFLDDAGETIYLGPNADVRALAGADLDDLDAEALYDVTGRFPPWIFAPSRLRWFEAMRPETHARIDRVTSLPGWYAHRLTGQIAVDPSIAADLMMWDIAEERPFAPELRLCRSRLWSPHFGRSDRAAPDTPGHPGSRHPFPDTRAWNDHANLLYDYRVVRVRAVAWRFSLSCVLLWSVPASVVAQDEPDALEQDAREISADERIAAIRELSQDAREISADERIAAIREMSLYARYAEAAAAADLFLARTDLTATQRNQAMEMKAIILLARRQRQRAREVLRELYGRDPEHQLLDRDVGPAVRSAFEREREARPPPATVTLENGTLPELRQRQSPPVVVRITEGADVVQELRLYYRNGETGPFEGVDMRLDEERSMARTRAPLMEGRDAYVVQYYIEAFAPSRAVVATIGSQAEPLSVAVPEEEETQTVTIVRGGGDVVVADGPNVAEEWWFWTIVGVVVAGGAATILALWFTNIIGPPACGSLGCDRWTLVEVRP